MTSLVLKYALGRAATPAHRAPTTAPPTIMAASISTLGVSAGSQRASPLAATAPM